MKGDARVQFEVIEELKWDTRVDEARVGVQVDGGVVTLTGRVDTYAMKLAAQEAAHRVAGVLDVANEIEVKTADGTARDDVDIARAVRMALEWDVLLPADRIRSTVAGGWVTLQGEVDLWRERADAEHAVLRLHGVRGVSNDITVRARHANPHSVRDAAIG